MKHLSTCLIEEKQSKRKGGLYHKTQVNLAYNSNRMEGSRLTEEQTRYIFENIHLASEDQACLMSSERGIFGRSQTRTIGFKDEEAVPVGDIQTTLPKDVETEMSKLNTWYNSFSEITVENIVEYHYRFEKIHPFQDGNGRVGRLIMFRECLRNSMIPFIIDNDHKQFYIRDLREFENVRGYLMDTCLSAQDTYTELVGYFYGGE